MTFLPTRPARRALGRSVASGLFLALGSAACLASLAATSQVAAARSFTVCIDPGHPSETSDGAADNGLSENKLNWQVGLRLRQKLLARSIGVVMTKARENQNVTNRRRAEIANAAHADVLIRLHCDDGGGRGFGWYYPDRSGRKYGVSGPPREVQAASREAATLINSAMIPMLRGSLASNPVRTDAATFVGGGQGGVLTGSIFARVPTALIEMCFINKRSDARFIASSAGQDKMASALSVGIEHYLRNRRLWPAR